MYRLTCMEETQWGEFPEALGDTLGQRMKKALRYSGKSVGDLALILEMHRNSLSGWLADRSRPLPIVLRMWAQETGVPYTWLLTGEWPAAAPAPTPAIKRTARKAPPKAPAKAARKTAARR